MEASDPFPPTTLDRATLLRGDAEALMRMWDRPDARMVVIRAGAIAVQAGDAGLGGGAVLALEPDPWRAAPAPCRVLLGTDHHGRPWWLVLASEALPDTIHPVRWAGLREIGPHLSALELEALMTAVAMESWHARHRFCPSCGQRTVVEAAGWVRRCDADGTEHYPRTDPAVIVVVIDEHDRALLARQVRWPAPWRSALAGFVEPGERAESAVRREVSEEVGLHLSGLRYMASQPWPFPGSLMLGFHARATSTDIRVDGTEIAEAEWYTKEQLEHAASSGTIQLPPAISIARGLIERWFGRPLPGSWLRG